VIPNSIKARLIAAVVLAQVVLGIGSVIVGGMYTQKRLRFAVDTALHSRAVTIAALVRATDGNPYRLSFETRMMPPPIDRRIRQDLYQIISPTGEIVVQSPNFPVGLDIPLPPPDHNNRHWWFDAAGLPYRGLIEYAPLFGATGDARNQRLLVMYATPTIYMHEQMREAGVYIAGVSLVLLLLTVLLALWGIRRGLRPLHKLAEQAGSISTRNWDLPQVAAGDRPDELVPLTNAMQTMLDGLRESFTQQREFLANAAHELKTPIAILKSTMQSLLQRPRSSDEYKTGLEESLEDVARLEKLVHWMLRLARAEQWAAGGLRRDLDQVEIAESCERALNRVRGLTKDRNIQLSLTGNPELSAYADSDDLELIWVNLLENAIRYSPDNSEIEVAVEAAANERACVRITDHGPGIPEAELHHIFERFHRGDPSRARDTGGFGLGLSITKALVDAYGGRIHATSEVGKGTCMIVELPVTQNVDQEAATVHQE